MFVALSIARHVYEMRLEGAQQPISPRTGHVQSGASATTKSKRVTEVSFLDDPFTGESTRYLEGTTGDCRRKGSDSHNLRASLRRLGFFNPYQ